MTIKNLYPTSRPSLDLNFAATKRLDPRISYSRASAGTYFGADGLLKSAAVNEARFDHNPITGESLGLLVEEARTNYALYSEQNIGWAPAWAITVPNVITAPDGTQTGSLLADDSSTSTHSIGRGFTNNQSTITFSVYVKRGSARYFAIGAKTTSPNASACFDFDNPSTITHQAGSISTFYSASLTLVGNGWYRVVVSHSGMGGGNGSLYLFTLNSQPASNGGMNDFNYLSYTGTSSLNIYWWGFQVEYGAFATSYIPTPATFTGRTSTATFYDSTGTIQTAASGVARSNAFFPDSNGVMRPAGLLLEAAATNLMLNSESLNSWSNNGSAVTISANSQVAPDGNTTADVLSQSAVSGAGRWISSNSTTINAGVTYTMSAWLKKISGTDAQPAIRFWHEGTLLSSVGAITTSWQRYSVTFTAASTSTNLTGLTIDWNTNGAANNFTFAAWGFQLEASPYPTSYIPTTTATVTRSADVSSSATVTRSADVAQITGTNFSSWYNATQGTLFGSGTPSSASIANQFLGCLSDNTDANFIGIARSYTNNVTDAGFGVFASSSNQAGLSVAAGSWTASQRRSLIGTYAVNDFAFSFNGGTVGTDASGLVPNVNQFRIGGATGPSPSPFNGAISRVTYWPTRLSNATLQAITRYSL